MSKTPKLRFKEFSGDWESKCGESIATKITKGSSPKWQGFNYQSEGVLFITSENVRDGYLDISEPKYLPLEFNEKQKSSSLVKGDILINIVGASIGRICEFNLDNVIANVNQAVCVFRVENKTTKKFINYHLQTPEIKKVLFGTQTESARPNLSLADIRGLEFNIPKTEEEQEKIAYFFSLIDDKISLQGEKVEALKDYKKGMMQKIFSRELRFKDDDGRDYPEWEEKKLGDISDIGTGSNDLQDKVDDGIYPFFVRSANIERINTYTFDGEAILIPGDGNIGQIYHYINGKFAYHQRVYKISDFVEGISGKYIYYYMSRFFLKEALKNSVKATVDSLRLPTLTGMKVLLPCIEEQVKISEVLNKLEEKIEREQEKLDSLNEYKKGLLQQMFV